MKRMQFKFGITFLSILSVCIGLSYISNIYFDFSWLGMEVGSENKTVHYWSVISITIGVVLILCLLIYDWSKKLSETLIFLGIFLLFVLQLLPLTAWLFILFVVDRGAGLIGIIPHCILIFTSIVVSYGLFRDGSNIA